MCKEKDIRNHIAHSQKLFALSLINDFGEDEDLDNWELISSEEVDYENDDRLNEELKFANTGKNHPNRNSEQDGRNSNGDYFKVRYQYSPLKVSDNSREFCKLMVEANKIYRKEDIITMGNQPVNPGWGPNGASTYSIWKYKGGGSCHHRWYRKVYMRKKTEPIQDVTTQTGISTTKSRNKGYNPPANEKEVPVAPKDMPNRGFIKKINWKS